MAALRPHITLWGERFAPSDRVGYAQAEHPFLGADFEFLARDPAAALWVSRVHCFTFPASMSHGPISGDVPGITAGAQRIADGVSAALFAEDYERVWRKLQAWDSPELRGDEYALSDDL